MNARPKSTGSTPAKGRASGSRIRAAKATNETAWTEASTVSQHSELHALVTALVAFVALWRPRLTDPIALVVLRGLEVMVGAVRGLVDAPAGTRLEVSADGPIVGLRLVNISRNPLGAMMDDVEQVAGFHFDRVRPGVIHRPVSEVAAHLGHLREMVERSFKLPPEDIHFRSQMTPHGYVISLHLDPTSDAPAEVNALTCHEPLTRPGFTNRLCELIVDLERHGEADPVLVAARTILLGLNTWFDSNEMRDVNNETWHEHHSAMIAAIVGTDTSDHTVSRTCVDTTMCELGDRLLSIHDHLRELQDSITNARSHLGNYGEDDGDKVVNAAHVLDETDQVFVYLIDYLTAAMTVISRGTRGTLSNAVRQLANIVDQLGERESPWRMSLDGARRGWFGMIGK